jgi:hypothetical protein
MVPGRAGTMTHDYKRNGTLDLFAALNVGSGEVLHDTRRSHTGRDVLTFFRWIDMHVDPDLELHVILDNLSAHKSQPVRDWLAHKKRRRWHLHFTPTTRHGSTSSSAGSPTGTTTPSPSSGPNPPTRSSTKSPADKPPSTGSPNPRHTN